MKNIIGNEKIFINSGNFNSDFSAGYYSSGGDNKCDRYCKG